VKSYKKHLLPKGSSVLQALERLNILAKDTIIFIVDENQKLVGSLTDGDIRRALLKGYDTKKLVDDIIQPNPRFLIKGQCDVLKVIYYRENNFRIIPIVDQDGQVCNVINFNEVKSYLPIDVVLMAGGRGERLKPLTDGVPKSMLKVGNKPIIEHNIDRLRLYGTENFWLSVRYLSEQITDHFGNGSDKNISVSYLYEDEPLGTIGAVSTIQDIEHDYVLVMNSDLLTNLNYEDFFLDFINRGADFSVLTIPYSVDIPYAVLETENENVLSFREKPTYTYYSNGGVYLMKKEVIGLIPKNTLYHATDLMERLIELNKKVVSYPLVGYWLDIGRKDDFDKAQKDIHHLNLNTI
jgi:dTDP-glucose pyrophosphorylase